MIQKYPNRSVLAYVRRSGGEVPGEVVAHPEAALCSRRGLVRLEAQDLTQG